MRLLLIRPFRKERYRRSKVIKASKMKAVYIDLETGSFSETKRNRIKKKKNEEELRLLVSFDREILHRVSRRASMG